MATGVSEIEIRPVEDRDTRQDFLSLPELIYVDDPHWVPPLLIFEAEKIDPKKHVFYEYGEGAFWVAYLDSKPVGRIGALVNHRHLEKYNDGAGHFSALEAIDDHKVFAKLFETAQAWLKAKGLTKMLGPANLTINEEFGMLIDGFDTPPYTLMGHARPYYARHLEALGFGKAKDLYAYLGRTSAQPESQHLPRLQRFAAKEGVTLRTSSFLKLGGDLRKMFALYNRAWEDNWGSVDMSKKEINHAAMTLWGLVAPGAVALAEKDGRLIGALIIFPNMNECITDLKGRLLPFGWLKLLWRMKVIHPRSVRVIITGVDKQFQNTPIGGALPLLLLSKVRPAQEKYKTEWAEGSWILEDNKRIIAYLEKTGFERYKTYRVYSREIAATS